MFVITSNRAASGFVRSLGANAAFDQAVAATLARVATDSTQPPSAQVPPMDVQETGAGYVLLFDLPGATKGDVQVSVEGRRVSIETVGHDAQSAFAVDDKDAPRSLYRERKPARYARTVSLPSEVEHASAQARFDNGVLTLTLAKKVAAVPTRIAVN